MLLHAQQQSRYIVEGFSYCYLLYMIEPKASLFHVRVKVGTRKFDINNYFNKFK